MALHTDDPDRPENVSDEDYFAAMQQKAAEVGDAGLHTLPDEVLARIERRRDGADQ